MLDISWANRRLEALAAKANRERIRTSKGLEKGSCQEGGPPELEEDGRWAAA